MLKLNLNNLIAERDQFQKDAKAEAKRLSDEQLKSMSQARRFVYCKTNLEIENKAGEPGIAQKTMEAQIQLAATAAVNSSGVCFN